MTELSGFCTRNHVGNFDREYVCGRRRVYSGLVGTYNKKRPNEKVRKYLGIQYLSEEALHEDEQPYPFYNNEDHDSPHRLWDGEVMSTLASYGQVWGVLRFSSWEEATEWARVSP